MATWIALLRGINVGGRNIIRMADLASDLEDAGLVDVRTYIQSGNLVFDASEESSMVLASTIAGVVYARGGFRPAVCVLTGKQLQATIDANPFPDGEPNTVHFFFFNQAPTNADLAALDAASSSNERYVIGNGALYVHAPDGVGRSKLAANAEKHLGVPTTARNLRTVQKVQEMTARR